ncbi:MAG: DinB family protein [Bacteroidia bacterium]
MQTQQQVFIKMALDAWQKENAKVDKLFASHTDEQLMAEVAPGRNSGIYLIGHLTAVNDAMFPLLGLGEKLYPQLENVFIANKDKSGLEKPSVSDLKKYWNEINAKLSQHFNEMQPDDWFTKHNSVSAEDFAKEPHRNKLNIIISRSIHQGYHLGQLAFLN